MKSKDCFFSASRFFMLCKKEIMEDWKKHALRIVMIYGLLAILFLINGYNTYDHVADKVAATGEELCASYVFNSLIVVLFLGGCWYASLVGERLKSKNGRLSVLLLPATQFEKYLARWVVAVVLCPLLLYVIHSLADWTRVIVLEIIYPEYGQMISHVSPFAYLDTLLLNAPKDYFTLLVVSFLYIFLQSCFVLGAMLWPKNSFAKTVAALLAVGLLFGWVLGCTVSNVIPDDFYLSNQSISLSEGEAALLFVLFLGVMSLFNWVIAYFRFKEMEIINRW